jgi:hypothetical protein
MTYGSFINGNRPVILQKDMVRILSSYWDLLV